ncbi:PEP-CTERM sorting domain-containing protein [Baaleninema sp.]|uniref:PEP-CTERM sorting domain-containing protein n=1 Tax=Baaleninema sp. TaxID=3101197 RepID=UPI003CFC6D44
MSLKNITTYAAPLLGATLAFSTAIAPAEAGSLKSGEEFGTNGILFTEDTTVTFEFNQTYGKFQSALRVFQAGDLNNALATLFEETKAYDAAPDQTQGKADDWIGSLGNTVTNQFAQFTFLANVEYTLGLDSGSDGTVYSTSSLNGGTQRTLFGSHGSISSDDGTTFTNAGDFTSIDPFNDPVALGFDDAGNGDDMDYQDMTLYAQAQRSTASVPEPSLTLGLIGLVAGGWQLRRRRQDA